MKITIEDYNETTAGIEVDYFIDGGEIETIIIDRYELHKDVMDNDLNISCEDKWDYKNEEHYTIDHVMPVDEYVEENMSELILNNLYNKFQPCVN